MTRSMKNVRRKPKRSPKSQGRSDIPPAPKRTYTTVSCPFPQASDTARVHSTATSVVTAQATANTNPTFYFSMAVSNATTGNFDQYRLLAVRISVAPQQNAIGLQTNSTTTLSTCYCVLDYDDATALTTVAQAEGYNNCVSLAPGESVSRTFRPRMAVAAYSGSFASYASVDPMWIDSASTGVQHYGMKLFIPGVTAAQTLLQSWLVTAEYAWELRNNLA